MTKLDDGGPSLAEVKLYLSNNFLTASSISNALFMLHNLVVLSLRENDLDSLPAGIGRLAGLRELSIGGNRLVRFVLIRLGISSRYIDLPSGRSAKPSAQAPHCHA